MAIKKKQDIEVKVLIDNREKDISYIKELIDGRITKDGIKIVEIEKQCVKPLGCEDKQSTGDVTIEYRIKGSNSDWIKSNLAIECKRGMDFFSSLYMKANRDRLMMEIQRGYDYKLDFYVVVTDSLSELTKKIHKVPKFRNSNVENTHFDMMIKLDDKLRECGFNGVITSGSDLTWCIKRIIKHHIKKNKLQYF